MTAIACCKHHLFKTAVPVCLECFKEMESSYRTHLSLAVEALNQIANETEPCKKCGKSHLYLKGYVVEDGKVIKDEKHDTWADKEDAHDYRRMKPKRIAIECLKRIKEEK